MLSFWIPLACLVLVLRLPPGSRSGVFLAWLFSWFRGFVFEGLPDEELACLADLGLLGFRTILL